MPENKLTVRDLLVSFASEIWIKVINDAPNIFQHLAYIFEGPKQVLPKYTALLEKLTEVNGEYS